MYGCIWVDGKYDGISESVAKYIEKVDSERVNNRKALGFGIETTKEWLQRTYNISVRSLYECICKNEAYREIDAPSTIKTRYILEDVPNGLAPEEHLGKIIGVENLYCTTIINLASSVCYIDFRGEGRRVSLDTLKLYILGFWAIAWCVNFLKK